MFSFSENENPAFPKKLRFQNVFPLWKRKSGIFEKAPFSKCFPSLKTKIRYFRKSSVLCSPFTRRALAGDLTAVIFPLWGLLIVLMAFLATFYWLLVAILTIHKCPGVGHLNRNSQLSSNAPPMPGLPPPQQLKIDRCIVPAAAVVTAKTPCGRHGTPQISNYFY